LSFGSYGETDGSCTDHPLNLRAPFTRSISGGMAGRTAMDEAGRLAEIDRRIEDFTRRVANQRRYVAELEAQGRDSSVSIDILHLLKQALAALVEHRKVIHCKLSEGTARRGR
jgi:hypothetical protein